MQKYMQDIVLESDLGTMGYMNMTRYFRRAKLCDAPSVTQVLTAKQPCVACVAHLHEITSLPWRGSACLRFKK